MRNVILVIVLAVLGNSVVCAGDFDEGVAAYERQDYSTAFKVFRRFAQQG